MFDLVQFDSEITWNDSRTTAELNDNSVMRFSLGDTTLLEIIPISFGVISESSGIIKKIRKHASIDNLAVSMETELKLPFGTEPTISRFYEFAFNHCKVTTDIDIRKGVSAKKLSIDSLFLPGDWKRAALLNASENGALDIEWTNLEDGKVFFEADKTFLSVVFENTDGLLFELGTGNDLWRWNSASASGLKSSFKITKTSQGVSVDRDVFMWEAETPVPPRNWRFHWYFSWLEKADIAEIKKPAKTLPFTDKDIIPAKGKMAAYDFSTVSLSDASKVRYNGILTDAQCVHDNASQNYLKKTIRSAIQQNNKHKIYFCNIEPHVCDAPSHLERPGKEALLHWDIISIMDYLLWANRQLAKGKSQLFLIPSNEKLLALPSIFGIAH